MDIIDEELAFLEDVLEEEKAKWRGVGLPPDVLEAIFEKVGDFMMVDPVGMALLREARPRPSALETEERPLTVRNELQRAVGDDE